MMTRLLLVEDDPNDVELFTRRMGTRFDIDIALSCRSAIAKIQEAQPDVILLDLKLPDSDGPDTLRRIKEVRTTAAIVITSATGDPDSIKQSILNTASGYLVKGRDTNPDMMESEIRKAIRSHATSMSLAKAINHLTNPPATL